MNSDRDGFGSATLDISVPVAKLINSNWFKEFWLQTIVWVQWLKNTYDFHHEKGTKKVEISQMLEKSFFFFNLQPTWAKFL